MRPEPGTERGIAPHTVLFSHPTNELPAIPPDPDKDGGQRAAQPAFVSAGPASDDGELGT